MASFEMDRSLFSDAFRIMANCPLCHTKYQPQLAKVVAEKEDAYLLHVPCAKCHSAVVAMVFANALGISSVGVLTDLTYEEVMTTRRQIVETDDVLELYQAMRDGSLSKQLSK
jgi:Ni,Fe-hydrogenase I small subunit